MGPVRSRLGRAAGSSDRSLKAKAIDERDRKPCNLVFLIDVSGSMQPATKLPLLKKAMKLLVDVLDERDRVSMVVYAGATGVVLDPTKGNQRAKIMSALDQLTAGGRTNGGAGIRLAYSLAQLEHFAGRLSFFFNGHSNFFEEVAKFRAARRLWASIAKKRYGADDEKLCRLRFHTQTAGSTLTAQQPEVNVVRTAMQALSAVLGGTQSLHTNSMDEALGLPTESAALLALRTQQVIAHETGVGDTIDPLAGSYFVESLTDAVERGARDYLDKIDRLGGAVRAIERGFQQKEIHEAAYRWQEKMDAGEKVVVGVNRFVNDDPLRPDPSLPLA